MYIVNEAYYGKIRSLHQIEDLIEKIRSKYYNRLWREELPRIYEKISKEKLFTDLNTIIANQFGYKASTIGIKANLEVSAATLHYVNRDNRLVFLDEINDQDLDGAIDVTDQGLRFNKSVIEVQIFISLSIGLLMSEKISSAEITAIILHEIGHGFSKIVMRSSKFNRRMDENFADGFAMMYGYGVELTSALDKLRMAQRHDETKSSIRDMPILNIITGIKDITMNLINRGVIGIDHPTTHRRMMNIINGLEYELKNNKQISKEQKKELQLCINRAKQEMRNYYNDTPFISDKMFKYYSKNLEPHIGKEIDADSYSNRYGSYKIMNDRINAFSQR